MENTIVIISVAVGSAICVGLAILSLRVMERLVSGPPMTPEQLAEVERRYQERLLQPHWSELEERFGFDVRPVLEELYSNHDCLLRTLFYFVPPERQCPDEDHFIARFEPADVETFDDIWFEIGDLRFPFARDDCGNYYCVELISDARESPVLYADHDGGDISQVAESLAEFLSWDTRVDDL